MPPVVNETCAENDLDSRVPLLLSNIVQEASDVLEQLVTDSLSKVLYSKVLGRLRDHPVASCHELAAASLQPSGLYWVRAANGSSVQVYCDFTTNFGVKPNGFVKVAEFDGSRQSHPCPPSLQEVKSCSQVLCGRGQSSPGCSSVHYSTFGIAYSVVCGRVLAYQFSTPNAFFAFQYDPTLSIDEAYLDGVSITYGSSPRQHIWSFAAGISRSRTDHSSCPCGSPRLLNTSSVPSFVGQSYFCESGNPGVQAMDGQLFCEDPLWDGIGCVDEACCGGGGWFCMDLENTVTDDIEVRLCGNENVLNEDTPIQSIHLYIQ